MPPRRRPMSQPGFFERLFEPTGRSPGTLIFEDEPPDRPPPPGNDDYDGPRHPLHKNWYEIPLAGYGVVKFRPSILHKDEVQTYRNNISYYLKDGTTKHDASWYADYIDRDAIFATWSGQIVDGPYAGRYSNDFQPEGVDMVDDLARVGELYGRPVGSD